MYCECILIFISVKWILFFARLLYNFTQFVDKLSALSVLMAAQSAIFLNFNTIKGPRKILHTIEDVFTCLWLGMQRYETFAAWSYCLVVVIDWSFSVNGKKPMANLGVIKKCYGSNILIINGPHLVISLILNPS